MKAAHASGILPMCAECALWRAIGARREDAGIGRCTLDGSTSSATERCSNFAPFSSAAPPPAPPSPQLTLI